MLRVLPPAIPIFPFCLTVFLEGNEARGSVVILPAHAESAPPCQLAWLARCSNVAQIKESSFKDGKNIGHIIKVRIGRWPTIITVKM
jgi:hypothetical protein